MKVDNLSDFPSKKGLKGTETAIQYNLVTNKIIKIEEKNIHVLTFFSF